MIPRPPYGLHQADVEAAVEDGRIVSITIRTKPAEPTAVFAPCPECGRSKSDFLSLLEARERFGYASSDCLHCTLTHWRR